MALLLAFHGGAEMIVTTGENRGLENAFGTSSAPSSTMVDTTVSARLVHADACSTLYRSRGAGIGLALLVLAALAAMQREAVRRPGRWVLSGDGAGGGLALAVAQSLAGSGADAPAAVRLESPWAALAREDPQLWQVRARLPARARHELEDEEMPS